MADDSPASVPPGDGSRPSAGPPPGPRARAVGEDEENAGGPLAVTRYEKDDGRTLLLYSVRRP